MSWPYSVTYVLASDPFDCPKLNASYLEHWVGQTQRVLPGGSRERFLMPPQSLVYLFDPNARAPVG